MKYRFTFTDDFMSKLNKFTEEHFSEERIDFKKSWNKWINEVDVKLSILNESNLLISNGYNDNILEKMFTCVRYYMKKKKCKGDDDNSYKLGSVDKTKNVDKHKHISPEILYIINQHLLANLSSNLSPAQLFNDFSLKHKELSLLFKDENKQKKIYKNRYYQNLNIL